MERAALLNAIIENAIDGIITINDRGVVESINPSACKLFGYEPDEVVGNNIAMLMPPPDRNRHDEYISRYEHTGQAHIIGIGREVQGLRKDGGRFPFRLGVSEVQYSGRKIYTGFIHDLTREKQAEDKLKEYAGRLEQQVAERTQSLQETVAALQQAKEEVSQSLIKEKELSQLKSRFVSMASHEFRTPLSSIQLSASLIEKYAEPFNSQNITKHIGKIKNSVGNLTGILNDFLSLERLEAGKIEPVYTRFNLVNFAEEITEEMQLVAKQNQDIIYQHTGTGSMVTIDQSLFKNCIINLIGNAIKYSGENTFIEFNTEITASHLIIIVKDNGIGIPESDQKHLFEAFFRAHNTGNIPGTGLGLNIVTRYTSLMNGAIKFESKVNQGYFIHHHFSYNRMKTKILIIEDNDDIRESTAEILELAGYEVKEADNGKTGVELAQQYHPDLILCDIMMPELDGYGVLYLLNKNPETATTPFIFLTAKAERLDFRKGMEMGADDYLTKPFDDIELLNAIESRLGKKEKQQAFYSKALKGIEHLAKIPADGINELQQLIAGRKVRQVKKRQVMYYNGDQPQGLYLVLQGCIKTIKLADDGRELMTGLFKADDYLGVAALLAGENYSETAEATEDSSVCLLPKENILTLINRYPQVGSEFIKILSNNVREKEEQLIELAYHSVRKRLAQTLVRLSKQSADPTQFKVSREELAAMAGIATETVSRTLTDFKDESLIEKKGSHIQVLD